MESLLQELAEPFERMTPAAASTLLSWHYGLEPTALTLLDTERDDSFRITTADGDVVLKVANPADDPAVIDLQSAAMTWAHEADASLPLQHIVPALDGSRSVEWNGRVARVLTWLPGELLADVLGERDGDGESESESRLDAGQLFALGASLGRLNRALVGFGHPAASRLLAWDLPRTPALRPYTDDPALLGLIDRFETEVLPALEALPRQVIHSDFHPGNVLVDAARPELVVGILDFGDVVHTARICDLGVAIAYLVPESGPAWSAAAPLVDGFDSVVPLLPEERALLPDLVAARLLMRTLIPSIVTQPRTDTMHYVERNRRLLDRILLEG